MLEVIVTSVLAFASTNIDDIFILTVFYGSRRYTSYTIIRGQFLGISFLVGISLIASLAGQFIDARVVGLLGLFPIYLSVKQFTELFKHGGEDQNSVSIPNSKTRSSVLAIAIVTVANGGDNIGVYVPLLSTLSGQEKVLLYTVFGLMIFMWCFVAKYLSDHPLLSKSVSKYAHIVMPVVLFILGIFILFESEAYSLVL